jgi:hypothetical protein
MFTWMAYSIVLALLLALAALCAERVARARHAASRVPWVAALVLSVALPLGGSDLVGRASHLITPALPAPMVAAQSRASASLDAAFLLSPILTSPASAITADRIAQGAWAAVSLAALATLAMSMFSLLRQQRRWGEARLHGVAVLVSETLGPAVIGQLRPRIVVPRWLLDAPPEQQRVVLAHESQHLKAGDSRLIAIGLVAVVAMPWNLPLWWQLSRLRRAIEVDCDSRVLAEGFDRRTYGEVLIEVGAHQGTGALGIMAMSEPRTFLERRLALLARGPTRRRIVAAVGLGLVGVALLVAALEVGASAAAGTVRVPAEVLMRYAGAYMVSEHVLLEIQTDGARLSAMMTGYGPEPENLLPTAINSFRMEHIDVGHVEFVTDASGAANKAVIVVRNTRQEATRISPAEADEMRQWRERWLKQRAEANAPEPGAADAVRTIVGSYVAGKPDYSQMVPLVKEQAKDAEKPVAQLLNGHGAVLAVVFKGVHRAVGRDVFEVQHEHGKTYWLIGIDEHGMVTELNAAPPEGYKSWAAAGGLPDL